MAKPLAYTFVSNDGRWIGRQELRRGRKRVWRIGDELVTEGPRGVFTTWRTVDVEGLRVTLAREQSRPRART